MELTAADSATPFLKRARFDPRAGVLVGSRCSECGARSWPARAACARCGSVAVSESPLPREGSLVSYTIVWVARPGLSTPYVLGQADFGDGASVFAHVRGLDSEVHVPTPVRVVISADESAVPRFWLTPDGAQSPAMPQERDQ
jgi:uncharacterized OB-fold protein